MEQHQRVLVDRALARPCSVDAPSTARLLQNVFRQAEPGEQRFYRALAKLDQRRSHWTAAESRLLRNTWAMIQSALPGNTAIVCTVFNAAASAATPAAAAASTAAGASAAADAAAAALFLLKLLLKHLLFMFSC